MSVAPGQVRRGLASVLSRTRSIRFGRLIRIPEHPKGDEALIKGLVAPLGSELSEVTSLLVPCPIVTTLLDIDKYRDNRTWRTRLDEPSATVVRINVDLQNRVDIVLEAGFRTPRPMSCGY
jgi:hypothetical protein